MRFLAITLLLSTTIITGCEVNTFKGEAEETVSGPSTGPTEPVETKSVSIYWDQPNLRVDGNTMMISEIGGYEVRYKNLSDDTFTSVIVPSSQTQYQFDTPIPVDKLVVEVATFDVDGVYSDFAQASESQ